MRFEEYFEEGGEILDHELRHPLDVEGMIEENNFDLLCITKDGDNFSGKVECIAKKKFSEGHAFTTEGQNFIQQKTIKSKRHYLNSNTKSLLLY